MFKIAYGPKLSIWLSVLEWMSFIEIPPCKIFALCIVWKGECWWIWCSFQQLALSTYSNAVNPSPCFGIFSTAQDCTIDPFLFSSNSTSCIAFFWFVSSVTVVFEGQVLLCVALMNHYFCTCFVHLIKKNMLCSRNEICCVFSPVNAARWLVMQAGN